MSGKGLGHKHIQDETAECHGFNVAYNCYPPPLCPSGLMLSEYMERGMVLCMQVEPQSVAMGHVGRRGTSDCSRRAGF